MAIASGGSVMDDVFVGREGELARLADVMARVRQNQPWLVTIEGEAGLGKTALARRAMASWSGSILLWARADSTEFDLEYGIIDQLLRGVDRGVLERYPLLDGDHATSSPFGVGAELLGVIGDLQADGPPAIVIDDLQWADRPSVEALSFMLRRLSVDPVLVLVTVRGDREHLEEPIRRMLLSVEQRLGLSLSGLRLEDVAALATAIGAEPSDPKAIELLYDRTGGHTLYLRTLMRDRESLDHERPEGRPVSPSLRAAIGDQLALLPKESRSLLEMLAVVNDRVPLALLGEAAHVETPSTALEPARRAGLVDWWPQEPSCPVVIRHALQRDAIYWGIAAGRRRELHARAVPVVDDAVAWSHRVAALDRPDEDLAGQLERLAGLETASGRLSLAATHLLWAADISPSRGDRERRLLTAAMHLMLAEEARGLALDESVEASRPSALRSCVLGTIAFASGQLGQAERRFLEALEEASADPDNQVLAATAANRLAGTYTLLGDGEQVITYARWALRAGCLDPAAESQTRTLVAIGASQVGGPRAALAELGHLPVSPARVDPIDVDALSFRGVFHLLAGDLNRSMADLTASLKLVRQGATITLGLRAYSYLALAQYLSGNWDDVLLTAEQGLSAAPIHSRRYELPLLHLAAGCVPAGRGATQDAEHHARLAEEEASSLDYGQERLYAGMARAFVCQAAADYLGMVEALADWQDEASLDGRSRLYAVLWRPLLVEGLLGSGQSEEAVIALGLLRAQGAHVRYLQPALAWLEGWWAELGGNPEQAEAFYQQGEDSPGQGSPVYTAHLSLAHGRLLRRTGQRRPAVERLRRAHDLFAALGASPFIARAAEELAACGLRQAPAPRNSSLQMTNRETEVAHLVGRGMTNAEIAAELFITPKAVEYHLGNIYAKFGFKGRQELRRLMADSRQLTAST